MNNQKHIDLITAYLAGTITSDQRAELNALIDGGDIDILEVKEMEATYRRLGKLPAPPPGRNLQHRFYDMLYEQTAAQPDTPGNGIAGWLMPLPRLSRLAVASTLFIAGMLLGNWLTPFQDYRQELMGLSAEVNQMREVIMMSLIDNGSATDRLKAVNVSSGLQSPDDRIIRALLKTLNNDTNINVRIAAVEALLQHASDPAARKGMIAAIGKQESPLVQAALADAMLILQEQQSVDEFRDLLQQEELNPGVRDKLEQTIAALI